MAYCLPADIDIPLTELVQLCDDSVPLIVTVEMLTAALAGGSLAAYPIAAQAATALVVSRINKSIADAGELIDGYVSGRYQVPMTAVPSLIKTIAVDLTLYKLYMRRKKKAVPEMVQKAYDNSTKLLRDIQSNKIAIGATPTGQTIPTATTSAAVFTSEDRVCSRNSMRDL